MPWNGLLNHSDAVCLLSTCILCSAVVKKCPGWAPTSCGKIDDDSGEHYWMHRCNPLAVPKNDTATTLTCKPDAVNGTFQCYFGQVGFLIGS